MSKREPLKLDSVHCFCCMTVDARKGTPQFLLGNGDGAVFCCDICQAGSNAFQVFISLGMLRSFEVYVAQIEGVPGEPAFKQTWRFQMIDPPLWTEGGTKEEAVEKGVEAYASLSRFLNTIQGLPRGY